MKLKTTFITLNNGTEICAPADTQLMTNFVLKEQGDWFEDEIPFVRDFIKPGMQALDIGANYGLYSTAIAGNLGENGKLWCFEPTQNTADALRQTITKNNFDDKVELIQAGLSDHEGQATFYTSANAELNSLTMTSSTTGEKQTIDLLTLDQCGEKYQWKSLDFIKLDAEGEEINILKAATKTLTECSPLIMFELKHGSEVNMPLITAFKELGYKSYYLIPSLNILTPLDMSKPVDGYQLNLFCCKDDTAEKLKKDGYLVQNPKALTTSKDIPSADFFNTLPFSNEITLNQNPATDAASENYRQAMNAYACSRDITLSNADRFLHLLQAFEVAKVILKTGEAKIERLCTIARIAYDIGQRMVGNQILTFIMENYITKARPFTIDEQFVTPGLTFETIKTKGRVNDWLCGAVLDEYIRKHAYSCYFSGQKIVPSFQKLESLGFLEADMKKRKAAMHSA